MSDKTQTWEGGYVLTDSKGRPCYYIRRQIDGKRHEVSTRAHTLKAALAHLQRFEADAKNYDPAGAKKREPLYITAKLVKEHLDWCRDVKGNTPHWVNNKAHYLAWWTEKIGDLDLRRVSLSDHIKPALAGAKGRAHKIATLKFFYAWLRKEQHVIALAEDPTFDMLPVPQAKPAQWKKSKVIPAEDFEAARKHMVGHWRDALDVQAGTGWHVTEVHRFAMGGAVDTYPGTAAGVGGVLVCPRTKAGDTLRTAVSAEVFEAGKRLLKHGKLSIREYHRTVIAACKAAKVTVFTPGRFRHTVATMAINNGADPAQVAAFLNHKSPQTTKRFYATHSTPAKVSTLR
jgi:integrase